MSLKYSQYDINDTLNRLHAFPADLLEIFTKIRIIFDRPAKTSGSLQVSSIIWARAATNNGRLLITYLYTSKTVQHAYVCLISITVKIVQGRCHSVSFDIFAFSFFFQILLKIISVLPFLL